MIRILYIIHGLDVGGMEKHLVEVCRNLDKKRFCPFVFCLSPGGILQQDIEAAGVEVKIPPHAALFKKGWFRYFFWLIREIRERKIDALHLYMGWTHITEVLAGKLAGATVIITTRRGFVNNLTGVRIFLRRFSNLFVNIIITNSLWMKNKTIWQEKANSKKIIVTYNGLPDIKISKYMNAKRKFTIIFVGRLSDVKRAQDLIKAISIVQDKLGDFECLIVGEGNKRRNIESLISSLHLEENIKLLGQRKDIPELLNKADVFMNCSEFESNSLAIIEAMRAGLPIIATNNGGNAELVTNEINGIIVPVGKPKAIADSLLKLKTEEVTRKKFGSENKRIFMSKFTLKPMIKSLENIYISALLPQK